MVWPTGVALSDQSRKANLKSVNKLGPNREPPLDRRKTMNEKNKIEMSKAESFWKTLEKSRQILEEIGPEQPDIPKW